MSGRSCLAFAPLLALACGGGGQNRQDAAVPPMRATGVLKPPGNRAVDLLFAIDDSPSMASAQFVLRDGFPAFMAALRALPGGAPDLHIAVISSTMGADGADGLSPSCDGDGKAGRFQFAPRGACTATNLEPGATFITDVGGVANYTGSIEDVLGCISILGESGCEFEQPFAAITRALGADGLGDPPAENAGFLRPDARLAIVMLGNEDDCTPRPGVGLFDDASTSTLASPLGPARSFRCNEFGHVCDGMAPVRYAPNGRADDRFTYDSCAPAEDAGKLKNVAETLAQIKALKNDPASEILVASIQGPTGPYTVGWRDIDPGDMPWPMMLPSCTSLDFRFGDPGIRTASLAFGFQDKGFVFSICDDSFVLALTRFAQAIGGLFAPSCITDPIADDVTRPGAQPDCRVRARTIDDSAAIIETPVPSCDDSGGTPPCWELVPGGPLCVGQVLQLVPDAAGPVPTVAYDCGVCTPGVAVLGCP